MCGIIGYAGHRPAVPVIIEGLRRLEYRGYDSAGVAFVQNKELNIVRAEGKLANLETKLESINVTMATSGIGHTRWATHGVPVERNAHPHCCQDGSLAIIHNGIIENYQQLKAELLEKGYEFRSETDTEVCANLIAECLRSTGSLDTAISMALQRAEGAYAIVVCDSRNPGTLYAARQSSPLVMGIGQGENFLASDIPAFLPYTRDVVFLEDGEMVRIDANSWSVMNVKDLSPVEKQVHHITWDVQAAQKGGYKHFMLKEIFEQPRVISDCLTGRMDWKQRTVTLPELEQAAIPSRLHIVACGTSFHAGLWGKQLLEQWAGVPVSVEIASEFRYRQPIMQQGEAVLVISQSGETADTLAGLRLAKEQGLPVIGLCNVVGSSIAREADTVVYTQAGPEISVASTKAMTSQMTALALLALYWGIRKGVLPDETRRAAVDGLEKLPGQLESELPRMREEAKRLAREYSSAHSFFFLGRGLSYPLALEGALKLKEISYIHAEGYAAGEMKHGPIALIDPEFPTFAVAPADDLYPKVKSNLQEVQARSGRIIALVHPGADLAVDSPWVMAEAWGPLSSFLALPALQLFSYEAADYLGKDVDQPRNLAKSVTVE
ncbi:glutamine--fructose-6-phosphate transaminase (isomerizing) [Oleidesulfovibrio alaskensis]|jgi:glucosamine--fructose-6-phosphate aminotransferase (isomerizing)|uniref:glutamine--fructose-6-phosphate transaminase (isomerizing) n=1 Tax=Oleidesulfovibrio alaskensis TaxID=58180 RepID=UPI001A50B54F|nr:glutamine--fructose-6-phosphate transaminase (isomerizing) [Oleidesulfovibrio alaskensis]MBL3583082.1 glutamine--fructose-6-phosphate transaminase (isomerizing) [Oleidesulfovibrio alaskensis]